jgi:hypothetical protein
MIVFQNSAARVRSTDRDQRDQCAWLECEHECVMIEYSGLLLCQKKSHYGSQASFLNFNKDYRKYVQYLYLQKSILWKYIQWST